MLDTSKLGSSGSVVKAAQYLTGYSAIKKASGTFDDAFESHVKNWQSKNSLTADGIIGSTTWSKIAANAPTCSTAKNAKSAYTCAVQILVGGLTVDGVYGSNTKKGVAAYQKAKGLTADGICGPKTWGALIGSSSSSSSAGQTVSGGKVINNCVHYLQWDSKWKNVKYSTHTSSQTIGNSGCGPTSMAQIMATFVDKNITPVEMCALSVANGYRTYDNGTAWGFFDFIAKKYATNFSNYIKTTSIETLKAGLKDGALAVGSMNSADGNFWTTGGHFITIIGYDDAGYIYANDPNKSTCPRKQLQSKFKTCLKQAFLFYPVKKDPEPVKTEISEPRAADSVTQASGASGSKIIDISYHQGNIDFDKVAKEVALVIVRAACGSDEDTKFESYAKAMNDRKIPFGVYCYSYAGDTAKAKDEAQKIVKYASPFKPLFYVMDAEESKITNVAIKAFANELRAQGASKIGCYVAHNHYGDYGFDSVRSLWDFVWIPRYGSNNGTLSGATKPSYKCDLWQYTSTGKVSGISGNVDHNTITGDGHDLNWFLDGKSDATVTPASSSPGSTSSKKVKVTGGSVYVRSEPNTSGSILGIVYKGDKLQYGGTTASTGWYSVVYNGKSGYISNKYSTLE